MSLEEAIKQKTFSDEKEKLAVNLTYTANWLNSQVKALLKKYKLTPQQYNVLRILRGQSPNPSSVLLIKDRMLDKESNVSRLIDKLVSSKLVTRKQCPNDRRQLDVTITEKGIEMLGDLDNRMRQLFNEILNVSESEASSLNSTLDKVRN